MMKIEYLPNNEHYFNYLDQKLIKSSITHFSFEISFVFSEPLIAKNKATS